MRAWVRKRIDAAHARTVGLRSGGAITLSTTLNPLKASPGDLAFVAGIAETLDRYEQQSDVAAAVTDRDDKREEI